MPGMIWPSLSASAVPGAGPPAVGGAMVEVAEPDGGMKVATAMGCTIGCVAMVGWAIWPGAGGSSGSGALGIGAGAPSGG
eukprot:4569166-Alexandrium_andersonii.AAC.1